MIGWCSRRRERGGGRSGYILKRATFVDFYLVPFETDGNRIELTVANEAATTYEDVEVRVVGVPAWVDLRHAELGSASRGDEDDAIPNQVRDDVKAGDSRLFQFTFSTDDSAPTEGIHPLIFEVYSGDELVVTKQIDIVVELPKELVLRGNYPNPFNPSTTIGFVQPEDGDVTLDIFDALGRSVDRLSKYGAKPGQQTFTWNATNRATGVYFYRLQFKSESGLKETRLGKMLLIR